MTIAELAMQLQRSAKNRSRKTTAIVENKVACFLRLSVQFNNYNDRLFVSMAENTQQIKNDRDYPVQSTCLIPYTAT